MKAPFFTVLIDTYNYGEFIEEAVSSVLAREFPPEEREILVVDDGSTDDTRQRLQKYKGAILYFTKAGLSSSACPGRCADEAQANVRFFCEEEFGTGKREGIRRQGLK
jgi:cellulose synthase/poly-beta-1,6-N-acetylglucosamine synthase-like glycosyltransferase